MKYFVIYNLGSEGGKSGLKKQLIESMFNDRRLAYTMKTTNTLSDAYAYSLEGNMSGADVIVAIGGDGTINQVINGRKTYIIR